MTTTFHARVLECLRASGKTMRAASLDGDLSETAIYKLLKKTEHSPTLATVEKLARGLGTTAPYLAYGIDIDPTGQPTIRDSGTLKINVDLLKQAIEFVLQHEGVDETRAATLAEILPEVLTGPPIDAVDGDPFRSFRVHLQLEERKFGHPKPL